MRKLTDLQNAVGPVQRAAVILTTVAFSLVVGVVGAQEAPVTEPTPVATPTPAPTPIPTADIPDRAVTTMAIVRGGQERARAGADLEQLEEDFAAEKSHLETLEVETRRRLGIQGPASVIEETEKAWVRLSARLDRWLSTLKERAVRFDELLGSLSSERGLWQLTFEAAREADLPPVVRREIDDTIRAVDAADREIRADRDRVLVLQSRIARAKVIADEMIARQREEILRRRRGLVGVDSPPLWRAFGVPGVDGSPEEQLTAMWERSAVEIRSYVTDETTGLLRHFLFLVILVAVLLVLRVKARLWVQQDRSLERTVRVLERPLSAGLIVSILLGEVFHPEAPLAWLDLLGLVLVLAFLRVFPLLVPGALRPLGYYLAVLLFLQQISELAPDGNLVDRLVLLVLSLAGAWTGWWVHRQMTREPPNIPRGWYRVVLLGSRLATVLFVVTAASNIVGAVGFATVLVTETLVCVFSAILFWITAAVLHAVIRVALLTRAARRLGVVRLHADEVRVTLFRLVNIAAVVGWSATVLDEVKLLAPAAALLKKVLAARLTLGEITIIPGDILLFAVVVWLSFKLSQLIRFSLDNDVYPRMDLPRGVPGTINRLTHYAVIVAGVMFAATAVGVDFTRMAFVIGALGVGIGFGLQNIVNNFVSGLILLFERPIRIGDRVEVGLLSGTVERIGMRASVVRTWQGAEVIVPNANLISSEVVNWTLSDDNHRMEIAVGVAYGTDPQRIIDLLVSVAAEHPNVLPDPEPVAFFLGFGESSLDFELRAWTGPDFVAVASDLRVAVNRALVDAGVEIPFPQRDLHVRSLDGSIASAKSHAEPAGAAADPRNPGSSREPGGEKA